MLINIALAVVMLGCFLGLWKCRKDQKKTKNQGMAVMLTLVLLGAAGCFFFRSGFLGDVGIGPGSGDLARTFSANVYGSQGYKFGKFLQERGLGNSRVLILLEQNYQSNESFRAFLEDFYNSGINRNNVTEATVFPPSENDNENMMISTFMRMTLNDFNRAVDAHSDCDIVISLVGLPKAGPARVGVLKKTSKQKLILVDEQQLTPVLTKQLEDGTLLAISRIRENADYETDVLPGTKEETFQLRYELLTSPK